MSQSDSLRRHRRHELSAEQQTRVELLPQSRVVDVMPFCGPEGDMVMVDWYWPVHSQFLTTAEALAVADAIKTAAVATANPPEEIR